MKTQYYHCKHCGHCFQQPTDTPITHCPQCQQTSHIHQITKQGYYYWKDSEAQQIKYRQYRYNETLGEAQAILWELPLIDYKGKDPHFIKNIYEETKISD